MNDAEREFFVTGAKTYLDVNDAMAEFHRQVQHQCTDVLATRLRDLNRACQMDWTSVDLKDYQWREGHHIGKQLSIDGFGGLYFCLELYRKNGSTGYGALTYLWRRRATLAPTIWAILKEAPSDTRWCDGSNLFFWQELAENRLPRFKSYLSKAIDEWVGFMEEVGGLKKHLPQA
jgi:hypothetical protein